MQPAALLIHVADVKGALEWYLAAFPQSRHIKNTHADIAVLTLGEFQLEIVPADSKVSSGASGTVLYWQVSSLSSEIRRLEQLGAHLYRGPLDKENNEAMCQLKDPFGNLIGLRGKWEISPHLQQDD